MPQLEFCSFCNSPSPKHEGGAEFNGKSISGKFCSKKCFDSWLKWKYAILSLERPLVMFPQNDQADGQMVFTK